MADRRRIDAAVSNADGADNNLSKTLKFDIQIISAATKITKTTQICRGIINIARSSL